MSDVECPSCDRSFGTERGKKVHHARIHDESLANKEEKECEVCGEVFTDYIDAGQSEASYCSEECMSQDYSEMASNGEIGFVASGYQTPSGDEHPSWVEREEVECWACGDIFEKRENKNRKVCSMECVYDLEEGWSTFRYQECQAPSCEEVFTVSPKGKEKKTCSKECANTLRTKTKVENDNLYPSRTFDKNLGHVVRSDWERIIGELLQAKSADYEYEPFLLEENGLRYIPDFKTENCIIEVKGRGSNNDEEKAKMCMRKRDETYVVVGRELESDVHIDWSNRREVLNYV